MDISNHEKAEKQESITVDSMKDVIRLVDNVPGEFVVNITWGEEDAKQ